jgi:hypothetical protein
LSNEEFLDTFDAALAAYAAPSLDASSTSA